MKIMTLEDVCLLITDGAHQSPRSVIEGKPMGSVKDMTRYGINLETCRKISQEDYELLVRQGCRPQVNDVLIAKDGNSCLNTVCVQRKAEELVLLSSVAILRPDTTRILPDYLWYFLESPRTRDYLKQAFISGAAIPRVILKDFKRAEIALPPMSEQFKIVSVLRPLDDFIELNERKIKVLEEMARRIYREWFVDFRFPGHEKVQMVDSGHSGFDLIPKGWTIGKLSEILELKSGYAFKSQSFVENGMWPLVTIKNVHEERFEPKCTSWIDDVPENVKSYCYLSSGDVLMSLTGNVGRVCRVYGGKFLLNQRVAKVISRTMSHKLAFPYCALNSMAVQDRMQRLAKGVAQPNLSPLETVQIDFLRPSEGLIEQLEAVVEPILDLITGAREENLRLFLIRDLLLPKMISGEMDVSELDLSAATEFSVPQSSYALKDAIASQLHARSRH